MTLEEQMICGALQTLNEEAFEDVVASERPSPTGGPSGETNAQNLQIQQPLTPIQETVEQDRITYGTGQRRLSPIISITPSDCCDDNNLQTINKLTPSHASSISSMSSVSLLGSSNEPITDGSNDNTQTSTVILMPDEKSFFDDTRL